MLDSIDWQNLGTIAIAAACGGVLGLEREFAGKPAGIRTHIFVCAGSALMMILGQGIVDQFQQREGNSILSADPIRTLQAIVVGISFLGAGTIVHQKGEGVEGLTTAAGIYLTAGIGVAAAVDRVGMALVITVAATLILIIVGLVEDWVGRFDRVSGPEEKGEIKSD